VLGANLKDMSQCGGPSGYSIDFLSSRVSAKIGFSTGVLTLLKHGAVYLELNRKTPGNS